MAYHPLTGQKHNIDFIINYMKKNKIPITREGYLNRAYPDGIPQPWTAEHEAGLPDEIRHFKHVGSVLSKMKATSRVKR